MKYFFYCFEFGIDAYVYTTIGLLTLRDPSAQTRDADINSRNLRKTLTMKLFFSPDDLKEFLVGFCLISVSVNYLYESNHRK